MTNKITLPSEFTEKVLLAMLSSAGWADKQAADVVQFAQDVTTHFVGSEQGTAGRKEVATVSLEQKAVINFIAGGETWFLDLCAYFNSVPSDTLIGVVSQLVARGKLFTIVGHDNDLGNPCILSSPSNDQLTRRTVSALRELFVSELADKTYDAVLSANNYLTMYSRAELDAAYWDACSLPHKRAQDSKVTAAPFYIDEHVAKQTDVLLDYLRTAKKRTAVVSTAWLAEYMGYNDSPFSLVLDGLASATGTELAVHSWTDGVAVPVGQDMIMLAGMYILIDKAAL